MNFSLIAVVFVVVLIAELPDKTMFATLVLGTRFSARWVFIGASAAFFIHTVIAVAAGSALSLLPDRLVQFVVAALFLFGAALMLRESRKPEEPDQVAATGSPIARSARTAVVSSFVVIFIGEWGDLTQIATANLAAQYQDPVAVTIGATLGLCTAALLAITAGQTLLRFISVKVLYRVGAVIFTGFAILSLVEALRGAGSM